MLAHRIVGPPRPLASIRPSMEHVGVQERAARVMAEVNRLLNRAALAEIDAALARFPTIECRSAATTETVAVDRSTRVVEILVVPYEEPTSVVFRGQTWTEVFSRSAFNDVEASTHTIRVNRDHDRTRTVGRVLTFDPADRRGLVARIQIANTVLGDETLALAGDDCLSCSVGFRVAPGGEVLDHRSRLRRINRAIIDHVALTSDPAYLGAAVLAVG
jgi:phage head maturation protease